MSIVKLQKGQRVHLTVSAVTQVQSQYGPKYKFAGHTPDDADAAVFLKTDTAERQLARIGLDIGTVVGQTVEIAKPDKYIDINRVDGAPAAIAPASAPAARPPAAPAPTNGKQPFTAGPHIHGMDPEPPASTGETVKADQWKRLLALHKRCLKFVLDEEAPMLVAAEVGDSPESVSARTAQLFIAATSAGLHR